MTTLYGRIKNGVLTLSGNNAGIRVDGGYLVVFDGPMPVAPDHVGPCGRRSSSAWPRTAFVVLRLSIDRIVITRPDGFITFAAIKWLHGVGSRLSCSSTGTVRVNPGNVARWASTSRLCAVPKRWRPGTALVTPLRRSFSTCKAYRTGRRCSPARQWRDSRAHH